MAKQHERMVVTSNCPDLVSDSRIGDAQSTTNLSCPIEKWPEVCAMLLKARVAQTAGTGVLKFDVSSIANPSVFDVASNPRKRKRERQCLTHLDCARYDQHSIPNGGDHVSRNRADHLVQSYVQDIHNLYPIVDLAQVSGVLNRLVGQRDQHSAATHLGRIRTSGKHLSLPRKPTKNLSNGDSSLIIFFTKLH